MAPRLDLNLCVIGCMVSKNIRMAGSGAKVGVCQLGQDRRILFIRYAGCVCVYVDCDKHHKQAVAALVNPGDSILVESPVYA